MKKQNYNKLQQKCASSSCALELDTSSAAYPPDPSTDTQ